MKIPPYLKPGDTIGLISTARKMNAADLELAVETLIKWGFKVKTGEHLFEQDHQYAGTDLQRAADLQAMLEDDNIKAILCARGGYGTLRIIDQIDFSNFIQNPKWIAGYSDITVLHAHIHANCAVATLHATMPVNFPTDFSETQATRTLYNALTGNTEQLSYTIEAHHLNRIGECKATVIGGNLSILYALAGSSSEIDTTGKILFIEDLDEYLYHIDRMMMQLKRSGKLDNLAGLIVGGMSDMRDNLIPFGKTAYEIIAEHSALYQYPVCFNFPAGHIDDNRAIQLGASYHLQVNSTTSIFTHLH